MSLGAIAVRRRHGGGGGGGGGSFPNALKIGANHAEQQGQSHILVWNELLKAGGNWYYSASGVGAQLPKANMDANYWPNSLPAGGDSFSKDLSANPTIVPYDVTWQGDITSITAAAGNHYTISGFSNVTKTATLTPTVDVTSGVNMVFTYVPGAIPPTNIKIKPQGSSGLYDPTVSAAIIGSHVGGAARWLDATGVNFNGGPSLGGGDWGLAWGGGTQAAPYYKHTLATRNTLNSGLWTPVYGISFTDGSANGTPVNDGYPIEALVQLSNDHNIDLWYNLPWNADPALIQFYAAYIRDHLNPGLTAYIELGNEVWNGGMTVNGQAGLESQAAHRTSGVGLDLTTINFAGGAQAARYVEKINEFLGYFKTAWNAGRTGGGSPPTLKRVAAWQHSLGALCGAILDYTPDGNPAHALKNNIEVFATAWYASPANINPTLGGGHLGSGYTGLTYAPYIDGLYKDSDNIWATAAAIKTVVEARGLTYASYEASSDTGFDDTNHATSVALQRSPEIYDWMMHWLHRGENAVPSAMLTFFSFMQPIGDRFGTWELMEYPGQTISKATTPKMQAVLDYLAGKRVLQPLYGQLIAPVGATNGTKVGHIKRRLIGSSVTITTTPAGAVSFVDATAADLVVQVADSSKFTGAGTISYDIAETGGSPSTTRHTTGSITVSAATFWSPHTSASDYDIQGANGLTAQRITSSGLSKLLWANAKRLDGYFEFDIGAGDEDASVGLSGTPGLVDASFDAHTVIWGGGGSVVIDGTTYGSWGALSTGTHGDIFLSPGKKLYGRKNNGAWMGATAAPSVNPDTDTGGIDLTAVLTGTTGLWPFVVDRSRFNLVARFADADLIHAKPSAAHDWTITPDLTAPVLSLPTGTQTGATTAHVGATTDEANGTLYAVVTTSSTAPTKAQIKAGLDAAGSAAVFAGSKAITATGAATINASGLTASTAYYAHLMHEDAAANQSNVVSSAQFTTGALGSGSTWDNTFNASFTYSADHLTATRSSGSGDQILRGNTGKTSGDYTVTPTIGGSDVGIGFGQAGTVSNTWAGSTGTVAYHPSGIIFFDGSGVDAGGTWTSSDAIKPAFDGTYVQFYKNGAPQCSLNGGLGVNVSGVITTAYPIAQSTTNGDVFPGDFANW